LRNPKSHFQLHYSYILQIIYLKRKQTGTLLPEKCHQTTLKNVNLFQKFHLTAGNVAFLQMLVTLKRASCGLALAALKMTDQRDKNLTIE